MNFNKIIIASVAVLGLAGLGGSYIYSAQKANIMQQEIEIELNKLQENPLVQVSYESVSGEATPTGSTVRISDPKFKYYIMPTVEAQITVDGDLLVTNNLASNKYSLKGDGKFHGELSVGDVLPEFPYSRIEWDADNLEIAMALINGADAAQILTGTPEEVIAKLLQVTLVETHSDNTVVTLHLKNGETLSISTLRNSSTIEQSFKDNSYEFHIRSNSTGFEYLSQANDMTPMTTEALIQRFQNVAYSDQKGDMSIDLYFKVAADALAQRMNSGIAALNPEELSITAKAELDYTIEPKDTVSLKFNVDKKPNDAVKGSWSTKSLREGHIAMIDRFIAEVDRLAEIYARMTPKNEEGTVLKYQFSKPELIKNVLEPVKLLGKVSENSKGQFSWKEDADKDQHFDLTVERYQVSGPTWGLDMAAEVHYLQRATESADPMDMNSQLVWEVTLDSSNLRGMTHGVTDWYNGPALDLAAHILGDASFKDSVRADETLIEAVLQTLELAGEQHGSNGLKIVVSQRANGEIRVGKFSAEELSGVFMQTLMQIAEAKQQLA